MKNKFYTYHLDDWAFEYESAYERLNKHFKTSSLKGFGIDHMREGIRAAGAILSYLSYSCHGQISHINSIRRIEKKDHLWMDYFTLESLEIFYPLRKGGASLIDVLDQSITPMGSRLLRRWLSLPLKDALKIKERQGWVDAFLNDLELCASVRSELKKISDIERLVPKTASFRILPIEVLSLLRSLTSLREIKKKFSTSKSSFFEQKKELISDFEPLEKKIENTLRETISFSSKEDIIKEGVSSKLDELKNLLSHSKEHLENLVVREKSLTGISSLKIDFNHVFGYYIEVRNTHKSKVPLSWIRKQTLSNAERYSSDELKEYESKILNAKEEIALIEKEIFSKLLNYICDFVEELQKNSAFLSRIDVLSSFAFLAHQNNYCKPQIDDSLDLFIKAGRHPVIEKNLPPGESYTANDLSLDSSKQILMITGPNMAGKSAFLRQSALLILMAQIGCYLPANEARIGVVDKIFSRVGASDNLAQGESTFMVEMNESAAIFNNLSARSFLILDEIGRGTGTYDGISIAWAMVEYLHKSKLRPKSLFATHYHELAEMSNEFERIENFYFSIKETKDHIIFLRKLIPGAIKHSFGLHVAALAGLPKEVIKRASEVLKKLESSKKESSKDSKETDSLSHQLKIFEEKSPRELRYQKIIKEILNLKLNELTPLEALLKLETFQKKISKNDI